MVANHANREELTSFVLSGGTEPWRLNIPCHQLDEANVPVVLLRISPLLPWPPSQLRVKGGHSEGQNLPHCEGNWISLLLQCEAELQSVLSHPAVSKTELLGLLHICILIVYLLIGL